MIICHNSRLTCSQILPFTDRLVSTVIAWGAKFSEHPLLLADREHNNKQSYLAKTLIQRTRELAEDLKVHRVSSPEHVVTALLIEPMQPRKYFPSDLLSELMLFFIISTESVEDSQGTPTWCDNEV